MTVEFQDVREVMSAYSAGLIEHHEARELLGLQDAVSEPDQKVA